MLGFYGDQGTRPVPANTMVLTSSRACTGRIYAKLPRGITYGQYWLDVRFANSVVRVPFRIMTDSEEKWLSKHLAEVQKDVRETFRKLDR